MIVAAYCRVSTLKEEQENSFQNQKSYFEREIEAKGHQLYKVYGDEGLTGTKLNNRKDLSEMLYDAGLDLIETEIELPLNKYGNYDGRFKRKSFSFEVSNRAPLFDEIWIKNTSRFARNTLSYDIIQKLRVKNVFIYFIDQDIYTRSISQDFLLKMFQLFDEQDSRDKSAKVKFGKLEGAKKGKVVTTGQIYGYKYIKENNSLEIIDEEAENIRLIYDMYLKGYGLRKLGIYLTKNNILTRKNKPFSNSTLKRILTNEKYHGTNVGNKYTTGSFDNKLSNVKVNDKEEWIIQENHERIPPIVTKEQFDEVQRVLEERTDSMSIKGVYTGTSKYAGKIYCGLCGEKYYSNKEGHRRFYCCKTKKHGDGIKKCKSVNVDESKLDDCLDPYDYYETVITSAKMYYQALEELKLLLNYRFSHKDEERIKEYRKEIQALEERRDKVIDLYADSSISKEEFEKRRIRYAKNIEELDNKIMVTGGKNEYILQSIKEIDETINLFKLEYNKATKLMETGFAGVTSDTLLEEVDIIYIYTHLADQDPEMKWHTPYAEIEVIYKFHSKHQKIFEKHGELLEQANKERREKNIELDWSSVKGIDAKN